METPISLIAAAMVAALAFSPVGPTEYSELLDPAATSASQVPATR